jgi:hypothetical protein
LFAKNFFGLFLAYILYSSYTKNSGFLQKKWFRIMIIIYIYS